MKLSETGKRGTEPVGQLLDFGYEAEYQEFQDI